MAAAAARYTRKELEARNRRNDLAIVIDNLVYDVTEFLEEHPGGVEVLLDNGGKDASRCFHDVGHSDVALEWRRRFLVGEVVDEDRREVTRRRRDSPPDLAEPVTAAATVSALVSVWGQPVALALLAALFYMYLFQ